MDKNRNYVDLHTHTRLSDGKLSSLELIHEAMKNGIKVLAITDHNRMLSKEKLEELEKMVEDKLILLRATEVSCKYKLMEREVELHIVALFLDKSVDLHPFLSFLEKNIGCDRRSYIEDILEYYMIN